MALRARVGRHTKSGMRECQNWADDQQTVIALLNRISAADGGAGGSLAGRIVAGISSDALYRAITKFEDKHFPGQRSGFLDPGGAMLARMEALIAGRTTAPPAVTPVPHPACEPVEVPSLGTIPGPILALLQSQQVRLPTRVRCLDPGEIATARAVYGESLVYGDIRITDGVGGDSRPFTFSHHTGSRWVVFLNLGSFAFDNPNRGIRTLIHELAHAWQSQHHPNPVQFMINCVQSQAEAAVATVVSAASSNPWVRIGGSLGGGPGIPDLDLGEADAYAYVPGGFFGDYAGEQIAQQVENSLSGAGLSARAVAGAAAIRAHVRSVRARDADPENVRSLSQVRYAFENTPGVVWPS